MTCKGAWDLAPKKKIVRLSYVLSVQQKNKAKQTHTNMELCLHRIFNFSSGTKFQVKFIA